MNPKLIASGILAALGLAALAATNEPAPDDLVAHEWGTFTAVVGSDGMEVPWWTPSLEGPAALPEFVRAPLGFVLRGKTGTGQFPSFLRMETPVIYFYAKEARDLSVKVDSSKIRTTEVYPATIPATTLAAQNETRWEVRILPPSDPIGRAMAAVGTRGAHYAHARNVPGASWVVGPKQAETQEVEKFIFYRGTGNATMPKRIHGVSDKGPLLIPGKEPLYLVEVDEAGLNWKRIEPSHEESPGTVEITRPLLDASASDDESALASELVVHLTSSGLTQEEASAMVNTWREAWLGESGLRVLEILPREWVDQTLPLTITPAPAKLERVFVARWELITPKTETQVLEALELTGTSEEKLEALRKLDLRRFGAAAFERAAAMRDARFRNASRELISALNATPVATTVAQ